MNDTYVTIAGNAVEDPVRRTTNSGDPFVHFRLASTPRRRTASGERCFGVSWTVGSGKSSRIKEDVTAIHQDLTPPVSHSVVRGGNSSYRSGRFRDW